MDQVFCHAASCKYRMDGVFDRSTQESISTPYHLRSGKGGISRTSRELSLQLFSEHSLLIFMLSLWPQQSRLFDLETKCNCLKLISVYLPRRCGLSEKSEWKTNKYVWYFYGQESLPVTFMSVVNGNPTLVHSMRFI